MIVDTYESRCCRL